MTSRDRMAIAMALGQPDRVPVMCQLAIGHTFLNSGLDPLEVWYSSDAFAEALVRLQRRYRFDGILVNLPGRPERVLSEALKVVRGPTEATITWRDGSKTRFPYDDLPHHSPAGPRPAPTLDRIDPEALTYIEAWDVSGISVPYRWGFDERDALPESFFPDYHLAGLHAVRARVGQTVSIHTEIFSPWSQLLDLLGYEQALMGIVDDPGKVSACLERLAEGAADLAVRQARAGADAVLISSAFAGAGFISRRHYSMFVLPHEKKIVDAVSSATEVPVYTHTCGAIGDRLDLMLATGTRGIDTLDPPPLGTVELAEAKRQLAGRAFIKGNIDPVHTLLPGPLATIRKDVTHRLRTGRPGGGYILSTACSVAPHTPPEHISVLADLVEEVGAYPEPQQQET